MERGREEEGEGIERERQRNRETDTQTPSGSDGGRGEGAKGVADDSWLASCSKRQGAGGGRLLVQTVKCPLVAFFLLHQKAAPGALYPFSFQPC